MKREIRWGTFFKLSLVVVISILSTNFFTMTSSNWIIKNMFIRSTTFLNTKLMDNIQKKVGETNNAYLMTLHFLEKDPALKNYFLADEENGAKKFMNTYNLLKVYHGLTQTHKIPNLLVVSNEGRFFSFTGERLSVPISDLEKLSYVAKTNGNSRRLQYTYQDEGITDSYTGKGCVIAAKKLFLPASNKNFASAYITILEEDFYEMFSEAVPEGSRMVLLSSSGQVVSSNQKEYLGCQRPELLSLVQTMVKEKEAYRTVKENHQAQIILASYLPELDLYMVNMVQEDALLNSYTKIRRNILFSGFFITGIAIAVIFMIIYHIVSPLNFFMHQLETYRNRKFEKVYSVKGNLEVKRMAEVYNQMVDEMDSYVTQLMAEQERSRWLEIEALQMQINPHFMYNTLASIKYLTWENNTEMVLDTLNALIGILKKTIGNMDEEIKLYEEIDLVRQYVFINQVRYGNTIEVEYFLDEDALGCMVPKMILQPFIENAFFHAFQIKKEGKIRIFAKKQSEDLICEVIDNGDGMSQDEAQDAIYSKKSHLTGIGIPNVHERIRLMFGEEYGVKIHCAKGVGTSVRLRLPYHLKKIPKQ